MAPKDKGAAKAPVDDIPRCCHPVLYYPLLLVCIIIIVVFGVLIFLEKVKVKEDNEPNKDMLAKLRKEVADWASKKELGESTIDAVSHLSNIEQLEEANLDKYEKARVIYAKTFLSKPTDRLWYPHGKSNFYISKTRKSWYDAEKFCRDRDAHLTSILTYEEQDYITSQLMEPAWIGLSKTTIGTWEWTDDSGFTTQYWSKEQSKSEPKEGGVEQDCVTIAPSFSTYNWKRANCFQLKKWVCKFRLEMDKS